MPEEHTTLKNLIGTASQIADRARNLADSAPGAGFIRQQAHEVEDRLLLHLKQRLDGLNGNAHGETARQTVDNLSDTAREVGSQAATAVTSLAERMATIMDRSLNQTPESAQQALFSKLLDQLVPDEVRMLSAMSDGSRFPVCHLEAASLLGGSNIRVLENLSRVGNEAGVMMQDAVPYYLGHLQTLGLVEIGPQDKDAANKYDMIENDSAVREASGKIEKEMKMKPKLQRRTVYLSPLGAKFISTCRNLGS